MTTPYIKAQLRELNRNLRTTPTDKKVSALEHFGYSLELNLSRIYRGRFQPPQEIQIDSSLGNYLQLGTNLACELQFDEQEAKSAREHILSEVEKRRQRLTNPNLWQRANNFLEELYRLCGQVPGI